MSIASSTRPRLVMHLRRGMNGVDQLGEQIAFYVLSVRYIGVALRKYPGEVLRLIAQMSLGAGGLALIGGSIAIVSFMLLNGGSLIAIIGFSELDKIGVSALEGFFSAYTNPRLGAPLICAVGLAATVGAGATAQIGAMRVNEEIDALEVIGIRSIAYLVSTRVLAGVVVVVPMYCMADIIAFTTTRFIVSDYNHQSTGGYDHYFNTFLRPIDLLWAVLQVIGQGTVIMLIHTYYGFNASGGPAGVGEATGRAVRASMIAAVFVTTVMAMALYGRSGGFHLSG